MSDNFINKYWRMNNLYKIVTKDGKLIKFQFNEEQERIWHECFNEKGQLIVDPEVLKARQLGITTFFVLIYFDDTIWTRNITSYIQSHDQDSIKKIFRYVKVAYDNMDKRLRPELDRGGGSQYEYYFPDMNSRIYVGLENRSNTIHRLHISETAFQTQSRIVATMGSLPPQVKYSRETTPNGLNWYFEDYFSTDRHKMFYPWFKHSNYVMSNTIDKYTTKEQKYLEKVKNRNGVTLSKEQMSFRRKKIKDLLSENAFNQEYPTDEESCFMVANPERLVIPEVEESLNLVIDANRPEYYNSYVFIDLGLKDSTAMLFGYVDFKRAKLVIEDELVVTYWTTKQKVERANEIEKDIGYIDPDRISDNDAQQIHDLNKDYEYKVRAVTKRSKQKGVNYKESLINQLRIAIGSGKIEINPRCKNLIFQLSFGMWNEARTDFERTYDLKKSKGVIMGHLDALMSLAYGYDNLDWNKNPYPNELEERLKTLDDLSRQEAEACIELKKPARKKRSSVRNKFGF